MSKKTTKTVIVKGFIVAEKSTYSKEVRFDFMTYKPSHEHWPERVVVREHEITFDVPADFDARPGMVENLEALKQKVRADFAAKVKQIDQEIQKLLAIEHTA